jgi:hypothetical protein
MYRPARRPEDQDLQDERINRIRAGYKIGIGFGEDAERIGDNMGERERECLLCGLCASLRLYVNPREPACSRKEKTPAQGTGALLWCSTYTEF